MSVTHYGRQVAGEPAICGATGPSVRWTAVRLVSCRYCQNIIDRLVADNFDELLDAANLLRRARPKETP